jgi:hypothetical protein
MNPGVFGRERLGEGVYQGPKETSVSVPLTPVDDVAKVTDGRAAVSQKLPHRRRIIVHHDSDATGLDCVHG